MRESACIDGSFPVRSLHGWRIAESSRTGRWLTTLGLTIGRASQPFTTL